MKTLFALLPIVSLIGVLAFKNRKSVRFIAVGLILLSALSIIGFLIAPHRFAEELVLKSSQSEEWSRGARDTRDVIYSILPTLGSSFLALATLALISNPKK